MRRTRMGSVVDHDPDSLLCPCGNHRGFDDFAVCTRRGVAITQQETNAGTGLLHVDEIDDPYLICPRCGRVYRVMRILHSNQAFVEHTADLSDPLIGVGLAAWNHHRAGSSSD